MAFDPDRFADIVAKAIDIRLAPVLARLTSIEARPLVPGPPGIPGRDGLNGKDGVDGQTGRDGASGLNGKDGVDGQTGRDGASGLNGKDGADGQTGRDGASGLNGKDGADAVAGPIAGLDPALISASADMLLRKELASLDAAAPPRMAKRIIRDARGKIERVIEEPVRG